MRHCRVLSGLTAILVSVNLVAVNLAHAIDVEGVLPASLDQPRIFLAISKDAKSAPLTAKGGDGGLADAIADALGEKKKKKKGDANDGEDTGTFAVDAFLDTGASGIMLSHPTAEALGIAHAKAGGKDVTFYDVGVAGLEPFTVTEAYCLRTHEYGGNTEGEDLARYAPVVGPYRLKIREAGGLMDELTGGLDVAGMPVMAGKVIVMDARPLAKFDKLLTKLVLPGDKSIPKVDSEIALSYVDYARFTKTEPASAPTVTLAANPMIGPHPFDKTDKTPPVTISHGGKSAKLSMLLDTGAASSMISVGAAKTLGITVEGTKLVGVDAKDQFILPIGGIGGAKNVPGFYVDVLELPAKTGEPIRYLRAPVLVIDISVQDEKTGEAFTLDGVFGMNNLVASASVSMSLTGGGVDDMHDGAFDFIVIDHAKKTLGVKARK